MSDLDLSKLNLRQDSNKPDEITQTRDNELSLLRAKFLDNIKGLLKDSGMDTQQQDRFCVNLQKMIGN